MIISVDDNAKIITTDVPQPLTSTSCVVDQIDITAADTNADTIYLGGDSVNSLTGNMKGRGLRPGDIVSYDRSIDLATKFISGTADDFVYWGGDRYG